MWIFWEGNICDFTVCLIKTLQVLSFLHHCMHWRGREKDMFIHMHIIILLKAIKSAEIWKGQLAEERLVHNKALVCWYLEQTQFCAVKLSTWRICIWVVGLKFTSNFNCSSSSSRKNEMFINVQKGAKHLLHSWWALLSFSPLCECVCTVFWSFHVPGVQGF